MRAISSGSPSIRKRGTNKPAADRLSYSLPNPTNQKSGLAIVCPVTSQVKGYPFEVPVPASCGLNGVILSDHVKSVDWKASRAEKIVHVPPATLNEVLARLTPLLGY